MEAHSAGHTLQLGCMRQCSRHGWPLSQQGKLLVSMCTHLQRRCCQWLTHSCPALLCFHRWIATYANARTALQARKGIAPAFMAGEPYCSQCSVWPGMPVCGGAANDGGSFSAWLEGWSHQSTPIQSVCPPSPAPLAPCLQPSGRVP